MPLLTALPLFQTDVTDLGSALSLFFAFCIGHALADFPLQGEFLAHGKNRHLTPPILASGNEPPKSIWLYCLTAHCLIHAGFVWLITGSALLAFIELVVHWIIDALKSEGKFDFGTDQWLHVITKVVYVVLIWQGLFSSAPVPLPIP